MEAVLQPTNRLRGITSCSVYPGGQLEECRLNERNIIPTRYGELIPHYSPPGVRDKELKSISFYESGTVRSIALETRTDIPTPLGSFPAELVTFHPDGSLDSIFPLNGQIGFGWSEQEEAALAESVRFDFPFGSFSAKPIGLRFYPGGALRSLILWPGELISVSTPVGPIPVRIGFKLHENGALASVEPAFPVAVPTPLGPVKAYDATALGMDADLNSLRFDPVGNLSDLSTSGDLLIKNRGTGVRSVFSSLSRLGLEDDDVIKVPIRLSFFSEHVLVDDVVHQDSFRMDECEFLFLPDFSSAADGCSGGCGGCSGCG